jgi:hypothetical protein
MTNFEKIKSMTVEEMAIVIDCPYSRQTIKDCCANCVVCCENWLESEVQEDE